MAVELKKRLLTTEAYHLMIEAGILTEDDKVELLNGEIIEMSPIKNPHKGIVNWFTNYLSQLLAGKAVISPQNPIKLGDYSEPEPDITLCKFDKNFYRDKDTTVEDIIVVIEVADSTLYKDREIKLPIYAENGIPAYWIVNLPDEQVEMYSNPMGKLYKSRELAVKGDMLNIPGFDLQIAVEDIFGE